MYKFAIKGMAHTLCPYLQKLDNLEIQEDFAEYLDEKGEFGIQSGYAKFKYDEQSNILFVIVEYLGERDLDSDELVSLIDYTKGQWSDGIGESFEQWPCYYSEEPYEVYDEDEGEFKMSNEVFVSMWYLGQPHPEITVTKI